MLAATLWKITIHFERRDDGGLRAWSDDVPGFVLSHHDADLVLADIQPALETILSCRLDSEVEISPLGDIRQALEDSGVVTPESPFLQTKEYVAKSIN